MITKRSLRFKIASAVIFILTIALSLIFTVQYIQFRSELINRIGFSATPIAELLKRSLIHGMEIRNLEEIKHIVNEVSNQKEVKKIVIVNKAGNIRISPNKDEIGKPWMLDDPTCQICHRYKPENRSQTIIFKSESGERVFRNVNPISNEERCHKCHNPGDKILGVLITDFSMAEIDRQLSMKFKEMLLTFLVTIAITGLTIIFIVNSFVLNKLEKILRATELIGAGELKQKVILTGNDEIGKLADSFNLMADNLQKSYELRKRKELLENVIDNIKESVIIYNSTGKIISFSKGAEKVFGFNAIEVVGKEFKILRNGREFLSESLRNINSFHGEILLKRKDGTPITSFVNLIPLKNESDELLGFVEIATDLTDEKNKEKLQHQLILSEKLAAIGKLASGVAHELNNPLSNILLYSKFMLEEFNPHDIKYKNMKNIVDSIMRCKAIVSSLLSYTKESSINLELNNINEIAEKTVMLFENELRNRNIEYEIKLTSDIPFIKCDAYQIQQVFINILQNAVESIGENGKIWIFSKLSKKGDFIIFGIRDSGPGIPAEIIDKIFDPFFTTKKMGIGLGLSICYGIIEKHHGKIWAERDNNLPAGNTTFYFKLPIW